MSLHERIDWIVLAALVGAGALHPESPAVWYTSFLLALAVLWVGILGGAAVVTVLSRRFGKRIQGVRTKPAPMLREALETARAMTVAASLAAWPIAQARLGHATGMITSLEGHNAWLVVFQTLAGVMVMDAWLYWKHRILHTRLFFGFHKAHHAFRDPTAFAGFAVAPVEALMTFWPILVLCHPAAVHWAPLYAGLVIGFVLLNFYLHCGVTFGLAERLLGVVRLNSSGFHNVHHAKASTHFGEAFTLWDRVCDTARG